MTTLLPILVLLASTTALLACIYMAVWLCSKPSRAETSDAYHLQMANWYLHMFAKKQAYKHIDLYSAGTSAKRNAEIAVMLIDHNRNDDAIPYFTTYMKLAAVETYNNMKKEEQALSDKVTQLVNQRIAELKDSDVT